MTSGVRRTNKQIERLKKKVVDFLIETMGATFETACRNNKLGPSEAYTWRKEDEKWNALVSAALEIKVERLLDLCESKMLQRINGVFYETKDEKKLIYQTLPDSTLIMYYTSNKGKHRGYGKTTIETDPNHPLKLEVTVTNKIVYPTKRETKS
ncbi:MAG: hypothetical protein ACUZ8E_17985 [Candidatus Anammoxibacter sp.]